MAFPIRSLVHQLTTTIEERPGTPLLVLGAAGTGKTSTVAAIEARLLAESRPVHRSEASQLPDDPAAFGSADSVVLIDDFDRSAQGSVDRLIRLVDGRPGQRPSVVLTARPSAAVAPESARLVELIAAQGAVADLGPLRDDELSATVSSLLDSPADAVLLEALERQTSGDPMLVSLTLRSWRDAGFIERGRLIGRPDVPSAAVRLLSSRIAQLGWQARAVLAAAMVLGEQSRDLLLPSGGLGRVWIELIDLGLATPGASLSAGVSLAAASTLAPEEVAEGHELAAATLAALAAPAPEVAELWRRSGSRSTLAGDAFAAAADALRVQDPARARRWLERVVALGSAPAFAGEAAMLCVLAGDDAQARLEANRALATSANDPVAAAALAAIGARNGAWHRTARRVHTIDHHPRLPADVWRAEHVWALLAAGDRGAALEQRSAEPRSPRSPLGEIAAEVTGLVADSLEDHLAADVIARLPAVCAGLGELEAWSEAPVAPHEWIAALALSLGDPLTARRVLVAVAGGRPVGVARSRADHLRRWIDLRLGLPGVADDDLSVPAGSIIAHACRAAAARRSGDVRALAEVTREFAAVAGTAVIDPLVLDPTLELLVCAARVGPRAIVDDLAGRIAAVQATLGGGVWSVRAAWVDLEIALVLRDANRLAAARATLEALATRIPTARPLARAAIVWSDVAGGRSITDDVEAAVEELRDLGMSWEAAQLAGQAAIRAEDVGAAKQLLGRARALRTAAADGEKSVTPAGLSWREVEVAELVLTGRTHKDIGAQLYISPKTVEHHVAHIRTKLGVTTRAEFLSALRSDLAARSDL